MADEPPPFLIEILFLCFFKLSPLVVPLSHMCSFTVFCYHPSSSLSLILFSQFLHSSYLQYSQTASLCLFSPIPPLHASLQLHKTSCSIFYTHFHCSHLSILSIYVHTCLIKFISTSCTLDCCVLFYAYIFDPYFDISKRLLYIP